MTTTLARPSDPDVRPLTTATPADTISAEIRELSMRISVATARMLQLIGEFDATEAWAGYGVKSCAHWLSWQCHISPHTAREHVRIARRLRELPLVKEEFATGGLSYAKVRALTRIADLDSEEDLISFAKAATASQVERTAAGWRRAETITPEERASRRRVTWSFDEDGMLRLNAVLDAEEGAILLAAIDAARVRLHGSTVEAAEATEATDTKSNDTEATDSMSNDADSMFNDTEATDTKSNDADLTAQTMPSPTGPAGHPMPSAADSLIALANAYLTAKDDASTQPVQTELVVTIDADVLARRANGGIATYQHGGTLTEGQARQFACETKLITILKDGPHILDVGRATRTVPRWMRRALLTRDGGCAMPGCTEHRPDRLHAHHVIHWADGGPTALDNLVMLCTAHHWAVHHDQLSVTAHAGRFTYIIADGVTLTPVPTLPDLSADATELPLPPAHDGPKRCETADGGPFDLDYILTVLTSRRHLRRRQNNADAPVAA